MNKSDCAYILKWSNKIRAVKMLGGKCCICGNSDIFCLSFHHKKDKLFTISEIIDRRWSKIEKELSNCILLCRNCHQEEHGGNTYCKRLKTSFLEFKGIDKCQKCGYKGKNNASLDFHHRHSEEKDFAIGNAYRFITTMKDKVELEINKCDVLCRNCHVHEHFDIDRFNRFKKEIEEKINTYKEYNEVDWNTVKSFNKDGFTNVQICEKMNLSKSTVSTILSRMNIDPVKVPVIEKKKICPSCKKEFECHGKYHVENTKYCCMKCKSIGDLKMDISKEELIDLLKTETYSSLARRFSVVPNTIKNLAKRYKIV